MDAQVAATLEANGGFLFCEPTLVGRGMYSGRNILAPNSDWEKHVDARGYLPVERWICSCTVALNDQRKEGEGLARVRLGDGSTTTLLSVAHVVLGAYQKRWPLVKLLDIGGARVSVFGHDETPPIPCHVHSGECVNGKLCGGGKLEAYHFPPPPAHVPMERVVCRLGLRPDTTKEQVVHALQDWGLGDTMYQLCNVFEVRQGDGWTIRPGIVHSPAPWPTLEVQLPQDDFNMLAYKLGLRVNDAAELQRLREAVVLKGLPSLEAVVEQAVDVRGSADPRFEQLWKRPQRELESGAWGSRHRIFFDEFYGESIALHAHSSYTIKGDARPYAMYIWRGSASVGDHGKHELDTRDNSELVVVPHHDILLAAGADGLLLYLLYPFSDTPQ